MYEMLRSVAIYLVRNLRNDTLKNIGKDFKIEKYSTVSSIIERIKVELINDPVFRERVGKLRNKINKGQRQT